MMVSTLPAYGGTKVRAYAHESKPKQGNAKQ